MRDYFVFDKIPPREWEESVPIGNGRMGATMMCGVSYENVFLNEETIWSSHNVGTPKPELYEKFEDIRKLLLEGKTLEANRLGNETLFPHCISRIRSYEGAGELRIGLHHSDACGSYQHKLDLIGGIATVEYDHEGSHYTREYFASYPDDVIAVRVTSSDDELDAWLSYDRPHCISVKTCNNELTAISKTTFGEHLFCVKVRVVSDGKVIAKGHNLHISGGKSFSAYISIATQFRHGNNFEDCVKFPEETDFDVLKARHIADFSSLMKRAEITLPASPEMNATPMSERFRIISFDKPQDDELTMLQWQFARYMLVSGSRPGSLPANLQGLWTKGISPEWSCDYHFNINIQTNYWPAEVTNLSECHLPLFDYMNNYLIEPGKKTAEISYHARGAVVHSVSDIYGFTTLQGGPWGVWPHGLSWLCLHMWEHYLFTKDEKFLRETAYETIRQSSLFFLDVMFEDKDGYLVWGPTISPENAFRVPDENGNLESAWLSLSTAMDTQIIGCLFRIFAESSKILGIENADTAQAVKALEKLPPMKIGKYGQIMEWCEDFTEIQIRHHHLSPGFAVYPDCAINRSTPELLKAVEVMVDRRSGWDGSGGFRACGWSLAWAMAIYARMGLGEKAYNMLDIFQHDVLSTNLFFLQPLATGHCFQIDGVEAFGAAVTEMLMQSHEGVIALLPALPARWDHGSFRGLRARGKIEADCSWENHSVTEFTLKGNGTVVLEFPATQKDLVFIDQNGNCLTVQNNRLTIHLDGESNFKIKK
ncbi:MAG: glycoside hydrolase family 95 protein [Ruminococcaceae bacterium]|nr:glycoside hydrolase family 95 protein [Oscillospiraceae bacterium]